MTAAEKLKALIDQAKSELAMLDKTGHVVVVGAGERTVVGGTAYLNNTGAGVHLYDESDYMKSAREIARVLRQAIDEIY